MIELKKHQSIFVMAQRLADIAILYFTIRFFIWWIGEVWSFKYVITTLLTILFFTVFASENGLYQSWRGSDFYGEFKNTIKASFFSFLVLLVFTRFIKFPANIETVFVVKWFIFATVCLGIWRFFTKLGLRSLRKLGLNHKKVIVLGAGDLGKNVAQVINKRPELRIDIIGFYDDNQAPGTYINGSKPVAGNLDDAIRFMRDNQGLVDEVIITLPFRAEQRIKFCLQAAYENSVPVSFVPDLFIFDLVQSRLRDFSGIPLISLADSPFKGVGGLLKRLEDLVFASIILIVIAIPMLIISLAVKLSSKGPVLFKQKRYGVGGKEVTIWKYRTMRVMEDGATVPQATKNDPRVTKLGSFLRRTSLDELPQFINVLQGSMSIVGPRPHAVAHNEIYRKLIPGYMLRHLVRPGITGWAQINGLRGETETLEKMQKRVEHDVYYVRNWSLWLDVKIILITMVKGFSSKQAY